MRHTIIETCSPLTAPSSTKLCHRSQTKREITDGSCLIVKLVPRSTNLHALFVEFSGTLLHRVVHFYSGKKSSGMHMRYNKNVYMANQKRLLSEFFAAYDGNLRNNCVYFTMMEIIETMVKALLYLSMLYLHMFSCGLK